jgi:hypothetical protein
VRLRLRTCTRKGDEHGETSTYWQGFGSGNWFVSSTSKIHCESASETLLSYKLFYFSSKDFLDQELTEEKPVEEVLEESNQILSSLNNKKDKTGLPEGFLIL